MEKNDMTQNIRRKHMFCLDKISALFGKIVLTFGGWEFKMSIQVPAVCHTLI